MKIHPMENRVLIERIKAEEKTASGILLSSSAQSSPVFKATVIEVGKGVNKDLVGNTIIYRGYPLFFEEEGRELAFIMVDEVDGTIDEKGA